MDRTAGEGHEPYPAVPPETGAPARLLVVPGAAVTRFHVDVIADAVDAADPDVAVAAGSEAAVVRPALRTADLPVLTPDRGVSADTAVAGDGVAVVAGPLDGLAPLAELLEGASAGRACLVSGALSLSVNPHRREASLEGLAAYADLPDGWLSGRVTHLSTAIRPGYRGTWSPPGGGELTVHGGGVAGGRLGAGTDGSAPPLVVVDVYANGAVHAEALPPERLGLRGLTGVGASRAEALREAGLGDRAAVADASRGALTALPGVGEETARGMRASAQAVARGEVVPTGGGSLPDGDPVFVDIETDGLAASTAWLIGVLDGTDGRYLAFREREPGDGTHLEAFLTWLEGNPGRPVVAYNGYEFDFPVIREQVAEHCPDRLSTWDGRYTFDPLSWARRGNAALPGRTNKLEAVAEALGWEPRTRGLDGATAAETYLAWRDRLEAAADPAAVEPPDWERLEAYCEDDVRALATVYEALREAAERETSVPTGAGSAQGSLSDFG
jgi:uncharacterized protein YprB with RNaseH-like and TPR domain